MLSLPDSVFFPPAILSLLFIPSVIETYRFILVLTPVAYKHRLSCYFTHFVTISTWTLLSIHYLNSYSLKTGIDYLSIPNPINHGYYYMLVLGVATKLSDLIAFMFSVLLLTFSYNKSMIVSPLENQKIDLFRVVTNVYIHYIPAFVFHCVPRRQQWMVGFEESAAALPNSTSLAIAVAIVLTWMVAYWDRFDQCYGLKYKVPTKVTTIFGKVKDKEVKHLIVPYVATATVAFTAARFVLEV